MNRRFVAALALGVLIGPFGSILRAEITPQKVRESISRAVSFLKKQQKNDGSWMGRPGQPGGVTALCTLALLEAGVKPSDPHIQQALRYLEKLKPERTYARALQTMVFCKAAPKQYMLRIKENVLWLESKQVSSGPNKGAWSYPAARGASADNSNSQFALLGLYEAERAGAPVQPETWRRANNYWKNCQRADGSWGYFKGHYGTGSMTCAGIASLIITSEKVRQSNAQANGDRITCCGQGDADNKEIKAGMAWLGNHFSVVRNPGERGWLLYYLYALERVGRLTSQRFFYNQRAGEKYDWYREGADYLVNQGQDALDGFFKGIDKIESDSLIATSFALLFLSKGRRPTLVAKLKYGPDDDWDKHRSDVNNLTRFVERRWEMDLTWQVVDLKAASVEDLLASPVLYLCGSRDILADDEKERRAIADKLRDYIDRGGFLLAEGYCGGVGFDQGFRQFVNELMFPEPEYQLRPLGPEHPIWYAELTVPPDEARPLWGLEFGCRTSVVYAPRHHPSLSCLWELYQPGSYRRLGRAVQTKIKGALAIGVNVLAYATNREFQDERKLGSIASEPRPTDPFPRGRLRIAKIRHPGGCNAAPRALVRLLEATGHQHKIRVDVKSRLIRLTDDALFDHHLVFMHGRNGFRLTPEEQQQLKVYIERGGMLFADSICASSGFTNSFRREMAEIFPEHNLEPVPVDAPLLTPAYGGSDLKLVKRRDPQARTGGGPLKATVRRVPPELEGIRIGDRWAVIFSRYDISCALEKHDSLECRGYVQEDAARIGLNVVLYSMQQ